MFTSNDYKFFNKAKHAAYLSDYYKVHIGCIAVYHSKIIGVGFNTDKTHPTQSYYNQFRIRNDDNHFKSRLHAEIKCINSISNMDIRFSKVKLYIYRVRKDDSPYGMCRPCESCMMAIKDLGIKNIYYTTDSGLVYEKL